jgi:hypothetical protein
MKKDETDRQSMVRMIKISSDDNGVCHTEETFGKRFRKGSENINGKRKINGKHGRK